MSTFHALANGFANALTLGNLFWALLGTTLGTAIGVLPGIGPALTVAVLLPGAFYFLRETRLPPVAALRAAGVAMAVATDLNPGSSPMRFAARAATTSAA